ncbi:MAG TPA: SGNH/GDSL hydrolase family protein [Opitutaceae bacterium]
MRRPLLLALVVTFTLAFNAGSAASTPPLLAGQRVLMLGDSITQDGRYVTFLEYYLHRLAPGSRCDLISIGLGSETISGLTEPGQASPRPNGLDRLDRALSTIKPTVVFACYGMNDGIYHPSSPDRLAAFSSGLDVLIAKVRAAGAKLVLITPPIFDPLPIPQRIAPADATVYGYQKAFAGYDDVLAELGAMVRTRSAADISVIDLHTAMRAALAEQRKSDPSFTFTPDGVHPGDLGHLLMARVIAAGLGLTPPAGTLDAELARINADPLLPLVRDRRTLRSESWLAHVGYTRGETYRSQYTQAAERAAARLQTEIERVAALPQAK